MPHRRNLPLNTPHFSSPLLEYRAYILDADGHIIGCVPLSCHDDVEARVKAKRLVDGHDIELWNGGRRVVRFSCRQK
jgi:hypothetical protein